MIEPKRTIKAPKFIILSFLTILNTLMLLRVLFTFTFHRITTHETLWSFILSSLYLIFVFISDANLYLFNSTKLEKFNSIIRNSYSIIAYSYCYSITFEFWTILFCGLVFGKNPFSEKKNVSLIAFVEALYLHLGITFIMVTDLIMTKREIEKKNNKIFLIINFIYLCYSVVVLLANYVFLMPAYPFMKNAGVGLMVLIFVFSLILLNGSYFLHLFLVRLINDKKANKKIQ